MRVLFAHIRQAIDLTYYAVNPPTVETRTSLDFEPTAAWRWAFEMEAPRSK